MLRRNQKENTNLSNYVYVSIMSQNIGSQVKPSQKQRKNAFSQRKEKGGPARKKKKGEKDFRSAKRRADPVHADAAAVGVPGGRVADHEADALGGLAHLTGLVLGCIEANFYKKICV